MYLPLGFDNAWDFDQWSGNFEIKVRGIFIVILGKSLYVSPCSRQVQLAAGQLQNGTQCMNHA
jgi:hypothetical protein